MTSMIQVEIRPVAALHPHPRNARQHTPAQIAQIAASLTEYAWTFPILIDEHNQVIAGHGRLMAAKKLAHDDVPVIVARNWSEAQKRAYMIADNKLTDNSSWDEALLAKELNDLKGVGIDVEGLGFEADEIDDLLKKLAESQPPDEFQSYDEEIAIEHTCPRCNYKWSGGT